MLSSLAAAALTAAAGFQLTTPHFDIAGHGAGIDLLRVDPSGRGWYGENLVSRLEIDGIEAAEQVSIQQLEDGLRLDGLVGRQRLPLTIANDNTPVPLAPGHVLGQSFRVARGGFTVVRAKTPTWNTTGAACIIRLRRDGPGGPVLAARRVTDIADNQWTELICPRQGPGEYMVELAEPEGTVGWWSHSQDVYGEGTAYTDGTAEPGRDRALRVEVDETYPATLTLRADGPKLTLRCDWQPPEGATPGSATLLWRTPWTQAGYDITPGSGARFRRFCTDRQNLLPAEQMKRQTTNFGPPLGGTWVEADGWGNADVRIAAATVHLNWSATADELTLHCSIPADAAGATWTIEALPRDDALPADWPAFFSSDPAFDHDLNGFFYERAFSYPGGGSAPWVAWSALIDGWYAGWRRDAQRRSIEGITVGDDGYVHTWGAARGWPFPDNERYDTRHFDTNARFIVAVWTYYAWTRDRAFLESQADRVRRAMAYQLNELHGRDGLLISNSKDVNGKHEGVGANYWDILPFGHLDAYGNAVFLGSLRAYQQIEQVLGGTFDAGLIERCRDAYDRTFWDAAAGRYIGCVDVDGGRHDYGFTFVNLEALYYGHGDAAKARAIYDWLEHGQTWEGKQDIYSRWVFAPRATTIYNPRWGPNAPEPPAGAGAPWWHFGWRGTPWEEQCQDGGAILYTSYFDLMNRAQYFGADNAWQRFGEILARYREPDRLCGGPPLYRGENPQQLHPGAVGVDIPFPESGLVPLWFLFGVVGVQADVDGLIVRPALPAALSVAGVRSLSWAGTSWTVTVTRDADGYAVELASPGRTVREHVPAGGAVRLREPAGEP